MGIFKEIKIFCAGSRKRMALVVSAAILLVSVFSVCIKAAGYSETVNNELADNLIRLHVIANSDKPEDQELKRDIRDIIIKYLEEELKTSKDVEQTKNIIDKNIQHIEELARAEIISQGSDYNVEAMLGMFPFPTKAYGDVVLPAGNYQALRVVIGDGAGANWWCVLFPPLCFVDATHGTIPDSVKQDLSRVLEEDEYKLITSNDTNMKMNFKFKIVEIFQKARLRLTSLF